MAFLASIPRRPTLLLALLVLALPAAAPGRAATAPWALPPLPGQLCRAAIVTAERNFAIPNGLLGAIGQVESGRRDPSTGVFLPWPWTVDADGGGHFYPTKAAAIAAVRSFQASGTRSIDVGCMQVNLLHHPHAFAALDQAFDPPTNAAYAARFLRKLHADTGSWPEAAAFYHSTTPALATTYERQVMAAWPAALREAAGVPASLPAGRLTPPPMLAAKTVPPMPARSGPFAGQAGAFMLANRPLHSPALPPVGPSALFGRGLAAYRAAPVLIASRAFHPGS
jgi:Transglycosylase SLT domain